MNQILDLDWCPEAGRGGPRERASRGVRGAKPLG